MKYRYILPVILPVVSAASQMTARTLDREHLSLRSRVYSGYLFSNRVELESHVYPSIDFGAAVSTGPSDMDIYAHAYGYPSFGIASCVCMTSLIEVPGASYFGNYYSLHGFFERDIWRCRNFAAGYSGEIGAAYNPVRYDPVSNPLNLYVSSAVMVHAAVGLHACWRLGEHAELGINLRAKHYSNGRTALPNLGLNMIEAGATLAWNLGKDSDGDSESYSSAGFHRDDEPDFDRGLHYGISAGGGVHCTKSDWSMYNVRFTEPEKKSTVFKAYPRFSVAADVLYRYALKFSSGVSLEMFYVPDYKTLRENDKSVYGEDMVRGRKYSPVSLGVALNQEFHYRNFALHIAVGAYILKPELGLSNDVSWNYQKAGLRYYIPEWKNIFFGMAVKANDFRESEYVEFSVGIRL